MAEQMQPTSDEQSPDPSDTYERAHPEHESGMGRLDNNTGATPRQSRDHVHDAVKNAQDPTRQINAQEEENPDGPVPLESDESLNDPEPPGWDPASAHHLNDRWHPPHQNPQSKK